MITHLLPIFFSLTFFPLHPFKCALSHPLSHFPLHSSTSLPREIRISNRADRPTNHRAHRAEKQVLARVAHCCSLCRPRPSQFHPRYSYGVFANLGSLPPIYFSAENALHCGLQHESKALGCALAWCHSCPLGSIHVDGIMRPQSR